MGRRGNIGTRVLSSRVPIKLYTRLCNEADDLEISLSEYVVSLLSNNNFSQGGETKIEYRDRIIEKEVPVEYHYDKIVDNPILVEENEFLKIKIKQIEFDLQKYKDIEDAKKRIIEQKDKQREAAISEKTRSERIELLTQVYNATENAQARKRGVGFQGTLEDWLKENGL